MTTSANGWPASPDPDALGLEWFTVAGRRFRVMRVAIPWGGEWSRPDEMHLEIAPWVSRDRVRAQVRHMGLP